MNSSCELLKSYPDVLSPSDIMETLKVGKNTTYFLLKNKNPKHKNRQTMQNTKGFPP